MAKLIKRFDKTICLFKFFRNFAKNFRTRALLNSIIIQIGIYGKDIKGSGISLS